MWPFDLNRKKREAEQRAREAAARQQRFTAVRPAMSSSSGRSTANSDSMLDASNIASPLHPVHQVSSYSDSAPASSHCAPSHSAHDHSSHSSYGGHSSHDSGSSHSSSSYDSGSSSSSDSGSSDSGSSSSSCD